MNNSNLFSEKFFFVSFIIDGKKIKQLYLGQTPSDSIELAKKCNPFGKSFKSCKTAYNTFGQKLNHK